MTSPKLKAPLFGRDLGEHSRHQVEVTQLLGDVPTVVAAVGLRVDRFQHLGSLLQQILAQAGQGLLAIPGTALRRPKMGDQLLERPKAAVGLQRRHVEAGEMVEIIAPVQFRQRHTDNPLGRCAAP